MSMGYTFVLPKNMKRNLRLVRVKLSFGIFEICIGHRLPHVYLTSAYLNMLLFVHLFISKSLPKTTTKNTIQTNLVSSPYDMLTTSSSLLRNSKHLISLPVTSSLVQLSVLANKTRRAICVFRS